MQTSDDMSKQTFQIAYDGPAVNGQIDSRELSYALLALSEIFQEANLVLNKTKSVISVKVNAGFTKGSFEINFEVAQTFLEYLLPFLACEKKYSAQDIAAALGFVVIKGKIAATSLIQIIKFIKGENYSITPSSKGTFKLKTQSGELEITEDALKLLQNPKIRKDTYALLKPIVNTGVDKFEIRQNNEVVESVGKEELKYFDNTPEYNNKTNDYISDKICEIISLSFEKDLLWKLFDGEHRFNAKLCDENFAGSIQADEISFKKGDKYKMKIKTTQQFSLNGDMKSTHEILQVLGKYENYIQGEFTL